jgi:hypothetical protein
LVRLKGSSLGIFKASSLLEEEQVMVEETTLLLERLTSRASMSKGDGNERKRSDFIIVSKQHCLLVSWL